MSMNYWMCEGIGIATSTLKPYLDTSKCIELIKEKSNNELIPDKRDFDIEDYFFGLFENLADMLCYCDDTDTLTWTGDGEGEYYFYYTPSYPWNRRENEPNSMVEVHERIKDSVQRLCSLTREQIEEFIDDDIYECGFG